MWRLWLRKRRSQTGLPATTAPADAVDYDVQRDLALPTEEPTVPDALAPYAGELIVGETTPAYDVDRDAPSE